MQGVLDVGHVEGEEAAIGADRVARERHRARFSNSAADEVEGRLGRLVDRRGRLLDGGQQPARVVHLADDLVHLGQLLGRLGDHQVGAFGDEVEVVVGHQRGDLDDDVTGRVKARHLEIHPDQHEVAG